MLRPRAPRMVCAQVGKPTQTIGISFPTYLLIFDSDSRHRLNFVISSTFNDNPALNSRRYVKEHPLSLDTRGLVFSVEAVPKFQNRRTRAQSANLSSRLLYCLIRASVRMFKPRLNRGTTSIYDRRVRGFRVQ